VRFRVPVGVAYGTDLDQVCEALLEVARANSNVLSEPPPNVFLEKFGESAIDFELVVWSNEMSNRPRRFRSDLNFAIAKKFKERGIEIPHPQRDLNFRRGVVRVELAGESSAGNVLQPPTVEKNAIKA
jgi:small-conductance mechanosensitive channel